MKKHIGIIGVIILLTGCWGEVYCPAFPKSKLNWIPYQENMSVRFFLDFSKRIKLLIASGFDVNRAAIP